MSDRQPIDGVVRTALRGSVTGVVARADEADVHRRVRRRARRHRVVAAAAAVTLVAATATGLAVTRRGTTGDGVATTAEPSTPTVQPTTVTTASPAPACTLPASLPFEPTTLPGDWTRSPYVRSVNGVPESWQSTDRPGIVEVWNGLRPDLPTPRAPETITVLGVPAEIGPISDGDSVVFQIGPTPCDRWALVAHPGVTRDELAAIALGLRLTTTNVYSWRIGLTVVGNATAVDTSTTAGAACAALGADASLSVINGVQTEPFGVAPVGAMLLVSVCTSATTNGPLDTVTAIDPLSGQKIAQFTDASPGFVPLAAFGAATVSPSEVRTGDTFTFTSATDAGAAVQVLPLCGDVATLFPITSTGLGNGGLLDPTGFWRDDRSHPTVATDCPAVASVFPWSYVVPAELAPGEYLICVGADTAPEACGRFTVQAG